MEYKILGAKVRVDVILISLVIGWILGFTLLSSCSKYSLLDGFRMVKEGYSNLMNAAALDYKMTAGIELKKNPDKEVLHFMKDFKEEYESIPEYSKCSQ
tara:strand:- start:5070 stop:5366 length:297 start_codon:yes stop_codon:yes gene_type:complete